MNLERSRPEPTRTRYVRQGLARVDIYQAANGRKLYVPTVPDWELNQMRRERAEREHDAPR